MNGMKETLNHILVDLFNRILIIEENYLQQAGISLTMNEIHLLDKVRQCNSKTMSDVAKALNITPSTFSINSKRLVKKGYLLRERDEVDKRIIRLGLSDIALEALTKHDVFHKEMIDNFVSEISINDQKYLLTSLNSLVEFFDRHYSN